MNNRIYHIKLESLDMDPTTHSTREWACPQCTAINKPRHDVRTVDVFCFICDKEMPLEEIIDNGNYLAWKEENKWAKAENTALFGFGTRRKSLLIRIRCGSNALENVDKIAGIVPGIMLTPGDELPWKKEPSAMLAQLAEIKGRHPELWVGVNFVGDYLPKVFKVLMEYQGRLDGLWVDNAYIESDSVSVPEMTLDSLSKVPCFDSSTLFIGGVYHKGGHAPPNFKRDGCEWFRHPDTQLEPTTTKAMNGYVDVICTSGENTGIPVEMEKVSRMRAVTEGKIKLALASGTTRENIDELLPFVDIFIVGTSVHGFEFWRKIEKNIGFWFGFLKKIENVLVWFGSEKRILPDEVTSLAERVALFEERSSELKQEP